MFYVCNILVVLFVLFFGSRMSVYASFCSFEHVWRYKIFYAESLNNILRER